LSPTSLLSPATLIIKSMSLLRKLVAIVKSSLPLWLAQEFVRFLELHFTVSLSSVVSSACLPPGTSLCTLPHCLGACQDAS
jgi:hypothetical protein